MTDLKYFGDCVLLSKTSQSDLASNVKYIVVCSATVSDKHNSFAKTTVYFPVEYDDIIKLSDNEYTYLASQGILGKSELPDSWRDTKGYIDGKTMYAKTITANRENYKFEVPEELKSFAN